MGGEIVAKSTPSGRARRDEIPALSAETVHGGPTVRPRDDPAGPSQPGGSGSAGAAGDFSLVPVTAVGQAGPCRAGTVPRLVHQVIHSAGQPLDPATRAFFEGRMAANT